MTVFVQGDEPAAGSVRAALTEGPVPVDRRIAELPTAGETERNFPELEKRAAAVRAAYVAADFTRCLSSLEQDEVWSPLAAGRRTLAARLLLWQAACETGAGDVAAARRTAALFAGLSLELPSEVVSASPEVEAILAEAAAASSRAARVRVEVSATASGAVVAVDGRAGSCVTPCALDLPPGEHIVRVESDGYTPAERRFRAAPPVTRVSLEPPPAPPEITAGQWVRRYAARGETESAPSVRLLSTALRTERLVMVTTTSREPPFLLRGVLGVSGAVVARSEREARDASQLEPAAEGLLRDLLLEGRVLEPAPPLTRRWGFWLGVAAASIAAGSATAYSLYEPPTRTEVTW